MTWKVTMPRKQLRYHQSLWTPGLTLTRPASQLRQGEASIARNVILSGGVIRRRPGWTKFHTAALPAGVTPVTGVFAHYFQGTKDIIAVAGQYLMRSTGADFTTITSSLVAFGDVPARPIFQTLHNKLYVAVEKGAGLAQQISSWDGTTWVQAVSGSPSSIMVKDYGNALWAAGDTATPNRLRWSGLIGTSGTDAWPAANYVDLHPGDGDRITGLGRTLSMLVVLKERSIHRVTGDPPDDAATDAGRLQATKIEGQPGCIAPRSVATNLDSVVYLGRRGVYAFNGSSVVELSRNVRPIFDDAHPTNMRYAVGTFITPKDYLVAWPTTSGGTRTLHICLDPVCIVESTLNPTAIATFQFTTEGEQPIYGFSTGLVGRQSETLDNGSPIPWEYQTGALPISNALETKTTRPGYLRGKAGTEDITIKILPDFSNNGGTSILDMV